MGFNFNISWQKPLSIERDSDGRWFNEIFSSFRSRKKTNIERFNQILKVAIFYAAVFNIIR